MTYSNEKPRVKIVGPNPLGAYQAYLVWGAEASIDSGPIHSGADHTSLRFWAEDHGFEVVNVNPDTFDNGDSIRIRLAQPSKKPSEMTGEQMDALIDVVRALIPTCANCEKPALYLCFNTTVLRGIPTCAEHSTDPRDPIEITQYATRFVRLMGG